MCTRGISGTTGMKRQIRFNMLERMEGEGILTKREPQRLNKLSNHCYSPKIYIHSEALSSSEGSNN